MDYLNQAFMKIVGVSSESMISSLPHKMQEKIALKKVEMKKSLDEVEADILAAETRVVTRRCRITALSDEELKKGMNTVYKAYLQKCNQGKTMRDEAAIISSKTHSNCDEYATLIASKWADAVIETISHNIHEKNLKDREDAFSSFY